MHGLGEETLPGDIELVVRSLTASGSRASSVSDWAAASEQGAMHDRNEDAWGQRAGTLFVLADGMGGRPAGDLAAVTAVASLLDSLSMVTDLDGWNRCMATASHEVRDAGLRRGHDRIGAAVGIVRVLDGRGVIAHAGDVRIVRLRNDQVQRLTTDHTVAHELDRAGLTADAVPGAHRRLGALTVFLGGTDSWRSFGVRSVDVRPGDRLVLLSDGVHRHLTPTDWTDAAAMHSSQGMADHLVVAARRRGGRDDRTVVAITVGAHP